MQMNICHYFGALLPHLWAQEAAVRAVRDAGAGDRTHTVTSQILKSNPHPSPKIYRRPETELAGVALYGD